MRTGLVVKAAQITTSVRGEVLNCLSILCLLGDIYSGVGFGQTSQGENGNGAREWDTASGGYGWTWFSPAWPHAGSSTSNDSFSTQ